jgi:Male gamete fusion factor
MTLPTHLPCSSMPVHSAPALTASCCCCCCCCVALAWCETATAPFMRTCCHTCHFPNAGQDTAASLQANRSAWLVIPTSLVSETGNDCDLVGTSFAAFRNQVVCSRPAADILHQSQPTSLRQAQRCAAEAAMWRSNKALDCSGTTPMQPLAVAPDATCSSSEKIESSPSWKAVPASSTATW